MSQPALYDEDIVLWSEQQAEVIRRLGRADHQQVPNDLDIENVAEEIESVGRSERAAVESQLHNILFHLMKLVAEPASEAARHWRGEVVGFQGEALRRYAPSMRQRIDLQDLWSRARLQSLLASDRSEELATILPVDSPFGLDDLLDHQPNPFALVRKIVSQDAAGSAE